MRYAKIKLRLRHVRNQLISFSESRLFERLKILSRRLLLAVILAAVGWQLYSIGFQEILQNLPAAPLFYLLFVLTYLSLPVFEILIYRQVWTVPKGLLFGQLLKKKVYNDEVVGYSGEVFLAVWAKKYLGMPQREMLKNVRDNNIMSAVSNNGVALLLLGIVSFSGLIDLSAYIQAFEAWQWLLGGFFVVLFAALLFHFRSYLFSLPRRTAAVVLSLYMIRFLLHNMMMIALWAAAVPGIPLRTWLLFITLMIIINRIPLLPSRDLIFMLAGIEISRTLELATASVAGMLLVYSALKKVLNLVLYLGISWQERKAAQK